MGPVHVLDNVPDMDVCGIIHLDLSLAYCLYAHVHECVHSVTPLPLPCDNNTIAFLQQLCEN